MRPVVDTPVNLRGLEFGGARPLFCVPLVAPDLENLMVQAGVAQAVDADLVEWRADFYQEAAAKDLTNALVQLRTVLRNKPIIFTLRAKAEGGAREMPQETRRASIGAVAATGLVDVIDLELCNEAAFIESVMRAAHENSVRVILSFHDFEKTPASEELLAKISLMHHRGADIAKIAVMPQNHGDVLRLLEVTLQARKRLPGLPMCTMAMGRLGILSRVAGFLFGSDMAYAVGLEASAPGQIPIAEARTISESLLKLAREDA